MYECVFVYKQVKIRGNSVDADWYSRQTVAFSPLTNTNITSYFNWYLLNVSIRKLVLSHTYVD